MSMLRSTGRIRTTHTGSLPRPPEILETLHQLAAGRPVDPTAYESALTQHVRDIVRRQVEAGTNTSSDRRLRKPDIPPYIGHQVPRLRAAVAGGGPTARDGPLGAVRRGAGLVH